MDILDVKPVGVLTGYLFVCQTTIERLSCVQVGFTDELNVITHLPGLLTVFPPSLPALLTLSLPSSVHLFEYFFPGAKDKGVNKTEKIIPVSRELTF